MQKHRSVKSYGQTRENWVDPNNELPDTSAPLRVLASDNSGHYRIPFAVVYDGFWRNASTREPLQVEIIGWRQA